MILLKVTTENARDVFGTQCIGGAEFAGLDFEGLDFDGPNRRGGF